MKKYKLDGVHYELDSSSVEAADGFALNGKMCGEKPTKGKCVGYVRMDEGSCIECYKSFNPLKIVIPLLLLLISVGATITFLLLNQEQDIAIGGTMLRTSVDENIVVFNGLMTYKDNQIDLRFTNGEYETKITVKGDGITTTETTLPPGESMYYMPITIDTNENVVSAIVTFDTATSTAEFPVLIEVTDNMNGSSGVSTYFAEEVLISE